MLGSPLTFAPAFLVLLVSLQEIAPAGKYVALVSIVYTVTLTVAEPISVRVMRNEWAR